MEIKDIGFVPPERPKPETPAEKLEYALTYKPKKEIVAAIIALIEERLDARREQTPLPTPTKPG